MFTVVGLSAFTGKKDGKRYINVYMTYSDQRIDGVGTESVLIRADRVEGGSLHLGSTVNVAYNKNGYLQSFTVLD